MTFRPVLPTLALVALLAGCPAGGMVPLPGASAAAGGAAKTFSIKLMNVAANDLLKLSNGKPETTPLAPGAWAVSTSDNVIWTAGQKDAGKGLESLAEDGNPAALGTALATVAGVKSAGTMKNPTGAADKPAAFPTQALETTVTASPGDKLSLAAMFVQTNDMFVGAQGIALFDDKGMPVSGDFTAKLGVWDAGTEKNQEPGLGANQAPRQAGPNTGDAEGGNVTNAADVKDGFTYPTADKIAKLTITPM